MYDIIIIGAGPAGISAGIYAVTRGKNLLILESQNVGGMISKVSTVTHYLGALANESGADFAKRMQEQAKAYKLLIHPEKVVAVHLSDEHKEITTDVSKYQARKVIIANGCRPKDLAIIGKEALVGKTYGLNAVQAARKWAGKRLYIIGAGDGAVKEAIYLANFAKEVIILNTEAELACIAEFKEKVLRLPNVKIWQQVQVQQLYGTERLEAFDIVHLESGQRKRIAAIDCAIFTYAGTTPNTELYTELQLDNGYIVTNENLQTNIEGVFAAGDIRVKSVRQIATAVSDGTIAAIKACAQL